MSEYQKVEVYRLVLSCSARDCRERLVSSTIVGSWDYDAERQFEYEAQAQGWSLWLSRGRRWYCPAHLPLPGHRMRRHEVRR